MRTAVSTLSNARLAPRGGMSSWCGLLTGLALACAAPAFVQAEDPPAHGEAAPHGAAADPHAAPADPHKPADPHAADPHAAEEHGHAAEIRAKSGQEVLHPNGHLTIQVFRSPEGDLRIITKEVHETSPITWQSDLALWSFVTFLVFIGLLTTFAWKPLMGGLRARETRFKSDIEGAESARLKAEQMLAEHTKKLDKVQDEVRAIIAEARKDAEQLRAQMIAAAEKEATAHKERAIVEIDRAKDSALSEVFAKLADAVADATEQVIGRALSDADHTRFVDQAVAEFARSRV